MDEIAKELNVNSLTDLIYKYNDVLNKIKSTDNMQQKHLIFMEFIGSQTPTAP